MYIINVKWHYDSAHFLKSYHGKCERLHGHRYTVEAALAFDRDLGPEVPRIVLVDTFKDEADAPPFWNASINSFVASISAVQPA